MGVLEIIAEQHLGVTALKSHPALRAALEQAEKATRRPEISADEKARIASIVELCFEYERETDPSEKANIIRTLEEISANTPLELPTKTIEEWEKDLQAKDSAYAKAVDEDAKLIKAFLWKYFSFRAKAGLKTQAAVAKKSGLRRSHVAVLEAGVHFPQQKTLQKLARAFAVDVADLLP